MRAMTLLWSNIPTITDELFLQMQDQLYYAIELAEEKDPDLENPEIVFFAMASHGLLAEYYADQGYNLRAVGEANKAYGLMKKGFEIVDSNPQFLLTTGLYNYFREKYPEKHPIYKPLLWFFRSGNIELGLRQLERAREESVLTKVEAYVYLSYIYLRYEYKPKKAQEYLGKIIQMYPNNYYAKGKYLESLANPEDFKKAPIEIIYSLMKHENSYYKLAGYVFLGYLEETVIKSPEKAEYAYRRGLEYGNDLESHGEYFKGLGYLGLARLLVQKEEYTEAREMLNMAVKYAETEQILQEARVLLSEL
jgi:tetratricopeptide (TPR) repeat protein